MEVQFTAYAYLPGYASLEGVINGSEEPLLSMGGRSNVFENDGYPFIGTATVTVKLNSKDEIVNERIKALREQLHTVRAENQRAENAILEQISKLQAIEYKPEAA